MPAPVATIPTTVSCRSKSTASRAKAMGRILLGRLGRLWVARLMRWVRFTIWLPLGAAGVQDAQQVAAAANRMQELDDGVVVNLAAQAPDIDIDDVGEA